LTSDVPTTEVPTSEVMVRTEALRKSYGTVEAVRGVSLEVLRGQVVVLIGPSGCGKSTFLRCINLLETPSAGSLQVGDRTIDFASGRSMPHGRELARFRARIGMVFQQFDLFPHMTVLRNVMSGPMIVKKLADRQAEAIARELLGKVGLGAFTARYPRELSGGQQQRVAIARAMAMAPEVMLFDEVTSALDPELVGEVLDVMKQLAIDGTTMIVVTHEMAFARDVADHVVVMDAGQVVEQGPAEEVLLQPKNPRTASFLSRFHSTIGERRA
jgi:polar amino acid transport system ATP-binding protein